MKKIVAKKIDARKRSLCLGMARLPDAMLELDEGVDHESSPHNPVKKHDEKILRIVRAIRVDSVADEQTYRVWFEASAPDAKDDDVAFKWMWDSQIRQKITDPTLLAQLDRAVTRADNDKPDIVDMPATSDTRRVVRIAMMIDETRLICKAYMDNTLKKIRDHITAEEFFACGGLMVKEKKYCLYRQYVYAKRDANAYSARMCFPSGKAVQSANDTYEFYPTDDENVDVRDDASCKVGAVQMLIRSPSPSE